MLRKHIVIGHWPEVRFILLCDDVPNLQKKYIYLYKDNKTKLYDVRTIFKHTQSASSFECIKLPQCQPLYCLTTMMIYIHTSVHKFIHQNIKLLIHFKNFNTNSDRCYYIIQLCEKSSQKNIIIMPLYTIWNRTCKSKLYPMVLQ